MPTFRLRALLASAAAFSGLCFPAAASAVQDEVLEPETARYESVPAAGTTTATATTAATVTAKTSTAAAPVSPAVVSEAVADDKLAVLSLLNNDFIQGERLRYKAEMKSFYQADGQKMLWIDGDHYSKSAENLIDLIAAARSHGFNPANYHAKVLSGLKDKTFSDPRLAAESEILLTDAAVRFGDDLSGMRVNPKDIEEDVNSWSRGISPQALLKALASSRDPDKMIAHLAPQDDIYKALQAELKSILEQIAANQDAGKPEERIKLSGGVLRPGKRSSVVPLLRAKLGVEAPAADADLYDDALKAAVMAFQKDHGLKDDGLVGPRTAIALNDGLKERLIKVLANLERRRWVRHPLPERFVEVNIPAMQLWAVESGKTAFTMPVIVGRKKRHTTSFVDEIVGVRFNPSWYVPDTIKKEDYLPELQKNPQALAEKGIAFRVWDADSQAMVNVLPEDIDWSKVTQGDLKSIQMVQGPGEHNALGKIRVLMPNQYDIYLHDTNTPELFAKDDRALSSGCVRLSEPRRIAEFVLGSNKGWSNDRLEAYLKKDKTLEIRAEQKLPVYLYYFTIWGQDRDSGKLIFGNDIYGLDAILVNRLKSNGQVDFPLI